MAFGVGVRQNDSLAAGVVAVGLVWGLQGVLELDLVAVASFLVPGMLVFKLVEVGANPRSNRFAILSIFFSTSTCYGVFLLSDLCRTQPNILEITQLLATTVWNISPYCISFMLLSLFSFSVELCTLFIAANIITI